MNCINLLESNSGIISSNLILYIDEHIIINYNILINYLMICIKLLELDSGIIGLNLIIFISISLNI